MTDERAPWYRHDARPWRWLSVGAALLAAAGSVTGLVDVGRSYGRETAAFVDQAVAQDIVNLAVVAPAIILLAWWARRSLIAHLAWLGALAFTVYNYVIYTVSIHVGPLFPVWLAVLGLSLYALVGGLAVLDVEAVRARFVHEPRRFAGWFLIVVAALFAALWLSQIATAIAAGTVPTGARELGLPSSPVHVLDLAGYLPAAIAAGVLLLRRRAWGYATAPALLVFLALTGLPVLVTPFVATARGDTPGWAVLAPMGAVAALSLGTAAWLLAAARPTVQTGR